MIPFFSILLLGFFLGMRHATDSDHVVAVTTIVSRQRHIGSAALTGLFWGIGHSITLLVVGGAIIVFGIVIPNRLGLSLEFGVALMLIFLGAWNLCSAMRPLRVDPVLGETHVHRHSDDSVSPARLDRIFGRVKSYWAIRPIIIGVVHGLAGSAAVALLVLPIIRQPVWALAYLCIFGLGTIVGMMLMTATIALPLTYTARFHFFHRHFGTAAGVLSLGFGLFLAYQIGFADGLFTH